MPTLLISLFSCALAAALLAQRAINELRGYLTQFQIRPGTRDLNHAQTREWVVVQREWSPLQRTLLTQHFERLAFATMQSEVLYAAICQEVLSDQAMAGCLR